MRAFIVFCFLGFLDAYVYQRLRVRFAFEGIGSSIVALFFSVLFVLLILWPLLDMAFRPDGLLSSHPFRDSLVHTSFIALGFISCLFVFVLVADIYSLAFDWHRVSHMHNRLALCFICSATIIAFTHGLYHAGKVQRHEIEVTFSTLPHSFDGYKIVQISDTHIGASLGNEFAKSVVDLANSVKPDVIVLTGDWADGMPNKLKPALEPFKELSAKDGVYYITGNHEYYWDAVQWINEAKQSGFTVLSNQAFTISRNTDNLSLVGIPDPTAAGFKGLPRPDVRKALESAPPQAFKVLLSHQPSVFDEAVRAGANFQLSGHTHAGQYFPFTIIIRLFQKYIHGLYEKDGSKLYVNWGTGFWGPPMRANAGEITVLTLRRKE